MVLGVTFRMLFVLVILTHEYRRIVHVTEDPTAAWTAHGNAWTIWNRKTVCTRTAGVDLVGDESGT